MTVKSASVREDYRVGLVALSGAAWLASIGCAMVAVAVQDCRWAFMWSLAAAAYFTIKAMTLVVAQVRPPITEVMAYIFLWPGLNPTRFFRFKSSNDASRLTRGGILNVFVGISLLYGVTPVLAAQPLAAAWSGMAGIVFVMHFGWFHLATAFWKSRGRDVEPLMHCPIAASTLADFWGRRWNIAFRDAAQSLVFRPASRRWGASAGTWLVFLASGLLHDVVISVPATGGYGGPTAYFLLQALGVHLSRFTSGIKARAMMFAFLLLPVGLLFHPASISHVMIPFLKTIGSIP